jgi:hypothetical protein
MLKSPAHLRGHVNPILAHPLGLAITNGGRSAPVFGELAPAAGKGLLVVAGHNTRNPTS